jgi:hypothetical protein
MAYARPDHTVFGVGHVGPSPCSLDLHFVLVYGYLGAWSIGLGKEAAPLILRIDVSDVIFSLGSWSSGEGRVTRQLM